MQNASKAYKESMKGIGRNRGYILATLGIINSKAQDKAEMDDGTEIVYFADPSKPFKGYTVDKVYATAEQDFSKVDGSMYFLPKKTSGMPYYNNGIVTLDLYGAIVISFQGEKGFDIKGLTINFGEYYPVDFTIETNNTKNSYKNNDKSVFVTEDVFDEADYFIITAQKMVNNQGRLRINQFSCGIVNTFTNKEVKSYSAKEYVSSLSDSLPSMDMSITVDNQSLYYSPDNPDSAFAFFEIGQEMKVAFGYDVTGEGDIEWLPSNRAYLKTWTANDREAKFTATDRFDFISGTYYKGILSQGGISLYDLAEDVLWNAGITDPREYFIDPYLKEVIVHNPIPAVKNSEALQIIANAGRCILFEDREGRIHLKSSFMPKMEASSNGETEYSHVENVIKDDEKDAYAIASNDFSVVDGSIFFMPKDKNYLNTGYISSSIWYENPEGTIAPRLAFRLGDAKRKYLSKAGYWNGITPIVTIEMEAAYVAYGLLIRFRNVAPREFVVRTYYQDKPVQTLTFENEELEFITREQFDRFDRMEIEFIRGYPGARVTIDNILIGDVTDYFIERNDMKASPTATRKNKIKTITVHRSVYREGKEEKEIESGEMLIQQDAEHTIYFDKPYHGIRAEITENTSNHSISVKESTCYYAVIEITGVTSEVLVKYSIHGYGYEVDQIKYIANHNANGDEIVWKNPLISTEDHARLVEEWLSTFYLGDVDYQINWRGDPRTDANDLFYLELKDRPRTLIRAYQNELKFNGAWSGAIKARKAVL